MTPDGPGLAGRPCEQIAAILRTALAPTARAGLLDAVGLSSPQPHCQWDEVRKQRISEGRHILIQLLRATCRA